MFAARDATVDELAQEVPLVRFETLALVRAGDLRAAGFRLEVEHELVGVAERDERGGEVADQLLSG